MTGLCSVCKELIHSPELAWQGGEIVSDDERARAERIQFASLVAFHMAQTHPPVLEEMETAMAEAGHAIALRYVLQSDTSTVRA